MNKDENMKSYFKNQHFTGAKTNIKKCQSYFKNQYIAKTDWIYSILKCLFFLPARGGSAELCYSIENQINYQFHDKQSLLHVLIRITIILYCGLLLGGSLIKVSEFIPNFFTIANCSPLSDYNATLTQWRELNSKWNCCGPSLKTWSISKTVIDTGTLNCHFYKLPCQSFQTLGSINMYDLLINKTDFLMQNPVFRKDTANAYVELVLQGKTLFSELSVAEDRLIKSQSLFSHFGTNFIPNMNVMDPTKLKVIASLELTWAKELDLEYLKLKQSDKNVDTLLNESEIHFELQLRQEWLSLAGLSQDAITQHITGLRDLEPVYNLASGAVPIFLGDNIPEAAAAATPVTEAEAAAEAQDVLTELDELLRNI